VNLQRCISRCKEILSEFAFRTRKQRFGCYVMRLNATTSKGLKKDAFKGQFLNAFFPLAGVLERMCEREWIFLFLRKCQSLFHALTLYLSTYWHNGMALNSFYSPSTSWIGSATGWEKKFCQTFMKPIQILTGVNWFNYKINCHFYAGMTCQNLFNDKTRRHIHICERQESTEDEGSIQ
jgi:hypothetical protein